MDRITLFCIAVTIGSTAAAAAAAQQPPAPSGEIDEVTITAERREGNLQTTPLAVTALSGAALEEQGVVNLAEMSQRVPNIVIGANTGTSSAARIFLRGVGETNSVYTAETGIAVYVDEGYVARQSGALFELFDVASVEVLRGPQGTLYGRNSSSGAVRINLARPTEAFSARGEITVGDFDRRDYRASISGPIAGERLRGYAGFTSRARDGISYNLFDGRSNLNDEDVEAWRLALEWQPNDAWNIYLNGAALDERSSPGIGAPQVLSFGRDYGVRNRNINVDPSRQYQKVFVDYANLTSSYTPDEAWKFKSITGWRYTSFDAHLDTDGVPANVFGQNRFRQNGHQYSQEFNVGFDGERVEFVGGAYAFVEDFVGYVVNPTSTQFFVSGQETKSYALYGQADWHLTPKLTATVGLRYTDETKDFRLNRLGSGTVSTANPLTNGRFNITSSDDVSRVTPRLGLSLEFSEDVFVFGSYAEGLKSGGYNATASTEFDARSAIAPEISRTFELGARSEFLDRRLRVNATAFYTEYDDYQLSAFDIVSNAPRRFNAANVEIKGVEFEITARPIPSLELFGTLGLMDGDFVEFVDTDPIRSPSVPIDVSDRELSNFAPYNFRFGFSWTVPWSLPGKLLVNGDVYGIGKRYLNVANAEQLAQDGYELLNASVRYQFPGDQVFLQLTGRNLTNESYYEAGFCIGGATCTVSNVRFWAPLRTVNATFGVRF